MSLKEKVALAHAEKAAEVRREKLQMGKLSMLCFDIIEYLALNGHDRKKLQNDYSVRQLFFYNESLKKQKRKEEKEKALINFTVMQAAFSGNTDALNKMLDRLN